jgi:hypothetical protein
MFATVTSVTALGMLLAGCASNNKFASLDGPDGACSAFQAPPYVVKGKTRYDQHWVDTQTETGIAGCGWERPKARPLSLDAKSKPMPVKVTPNAVAKKRWWQIKP